MFSTWLSWGYGCLQSKTTEVKCHFHIKDTHSRQGSPLSMWTPMAWLRSHISGSSMVMLLFFSPFHTYSLEGRPYVQPTLKRVKSYFHCLDNRVSKNYLEFFCMGDLSLLPYLLIQSLIYISMNSWMFVLCLGYNPA